MRWRGKEYRVVHYIRQTFCCRNVRKIVVCLPAQCKFSVVVWIWFYLHSNKNGMTQLAREKDRVCTSVRSNFVAWILILAMVAKLCGCLMVYFYLLFYDLFIFLMLNRWTTCRRVVRLSVGGDKCDSDEDKFGRRKKTQIAPTPETVNR